MRPIAKARLFGLLIAVVGIGLGIHFGLEARRINHDFYRWMDARPFDTPVDFSQPSTLIVPFTQTCQTAHSEAILFECLELEEQQREEPATLFAGIKGEMSVRNATGETTESTIISSTSISYNNGAIILASFAPFALGDYRATIRIDSGAPTLAELPQRVYARYMLCGLEILPAYLCGAIALASAFVGLIAAACSLPGLIRFGISPAQVVAAH